MRLRTDAALLEPRSRSGACHLTVTSGQLAVTFLEALAASTRARIVAPDARHARGTGAHVERRALLADAAVVVGMRVLHVADHLGVLLDRLRGLCGLLLRLHANRQQHL